MQQETVGSEHGVFIENSTGVTAGSVCNSGLSLSFSQVANWVWSG